MENFIGVTGSRLLKRLQPIGVRIFIILFDSLDLQNLILLGILKLKVQSHFSDIDCSNGINFD